MKTLLPVLTLVLCAPPIFGEEPADRTITIRGDGRPAEAAKISSIWLYPEDYEGITLKLYGFIYEPENFEYFPELNGYIFSCEPVVAGRNNAFHAHIGNANFLSREKLNFFCSTADGQRIRRMFKERPGEVALPAEVVIEVKRRDNVYLGVVKSFEPRNATEENNRVRSDLRREARRQGDDNRDTARPRRADASESRTSGRAESAAPRSDGGSGTAGTAAPRSADVPPDRSYLGQFEPSPYFRGAAPRFRNYQYQYPMSPQQLPESYFYYRRPPYYYGFAPPYAYPYTLPYYIPGPPPQIAPDIYPRPQRRWH
jgi:hypothetical protein